MLEMADFSDQMMTLMHMPEEEKYRGLAKRAMTLGRPPPPIPPPPLPSLQVSSLVPQQIWWLQL